MPFASASQERSPAIDHQMLRPVQATRPTAAPAATRPARSSRGSAMRPTRPADDESRRDEHRGGSERCRRVGAGGAAGEECPGDEDGDRGEDGAHAAPVRFRA